MATLKGHRGRRISTAAGSGFGETWRLCEGKRERTGTRFIPVTLPLEWSTAAPEECREIGLGINRWTKTCLWWKVAFFNIWRVWNVRTKISPTCSWMRFEPLFCLIAQPIADVLFEDAPLACAQPIAFCKGAEVFLKIRWVYCANCYPLRRWSLVLNAEQLSIGWTVISCFVKVHLSPLCACVHEHKIAEEFLPTILFLLTPTAINLIYMHLRYAFLISAFL